MARFKEYCMSAYSQKAEDFEMMHYRIKKILSASLFAAAGKLHHMDGCFELLGCDILIDDNFNPHLIEINTNPALFLDTEPQKAVIPQVVHKSLDLILHAYKSPENKEALMKANSQSDVEGWDLIYNEQTDFFLK